MGNENSKLGAERELFQAYLDDCQEHDLEPNVAGAFRFALQASSLPVGVPAITPAMIEAGANQVVAPIATAGKKAEAVFRAMLAAAPAAPTVKESLSVAPTVKAEPQSIEVLGKTCIDGGTCHHACTTRCFRRECCTHFSDYKGPWAYPKEEASTSMPAAGSAAEDVEVVAWRVSHPDTAWRVYERNPESWAAGDYEIQDLMTVAQCMRMLDQQRAALSAQQSAPERVSVPVEFRKVSDKILAKLIRFADCAEDFEAGGVDIGRDWLDTLTRLGLLERVQRSPALWQTTDEADAIIDAQRALLASHGRGEA